MFLQVLKTPAFWLFTFYSLFHALEGIDHLVIGLLGDPVDMAGFISLDAFPEPNHPKHAIFIGSGENGGILIAGDLGLAGQIVTEGSRLRMTVTKLGE